MNKDRDQLNEEGYKGLKFIIRNVAFKIFNPVLVFFPVYLQREERKREQTSQDIDFSSISHFGSTTKGNTDANTYLSGTVST